MNILIIHTGSSGCYEIKSIEAKGIYCTGSDSCTTDDYSLARLTTTYSGLFCSGYNSCSNARLNAAGRVLCDGSHSCKNATVTGGKGVGCYGEQSCVQTQIKDADKVSIHGWAAALESEIYGVSLVQAHGYDSMHRAYIDSDNLNEMTIEIFGQGAGNQAVVVCRNGATCNLFCQDGGCFRLSYVCEDGAVCNVTPNGCLSDNSVLAVKGNRCPTFTKEIPLKQTRKINVEEDETMDRIQSDTEINCLSQASCFNQALTNDDAINCGGEFSCKDCQIEATNSVNADNTWCSM